MVSETCILVCSCDAYADIWPIFFKFFREAWPDCHYPIYINTESLSYSDPYFHVIPINDTNTSDTWSLRLIKCLKKIKERYVLVILDDFFIYSKVDDNEINRCIEWIKSDINIACIGFRNNPYRYADKEISPYILRKPNERYIVNLLPAIWNKKALLHLLSPHENAWQFEWFGTERAKLSDYSFYELGKYERQVIPFNISITDGYGLCQGKWTKETVNLFRQHRVDIDFNLRGFCNPQVINTSVDTPKRTISDRFRYFLYGGLPDGDYINDKKKMPFYAQLKLMLRHPKYFISEILKNKLIYLFQLDKGNSISTK